MTTRYISAVYVGISVLTVLVFGANNNPTTTKHLSTPRPTPESFEYTSTWFTYDAINHFMCCAHTTRLMRVCLCYHVPYEEQRLMHDREKSIEIEERILSLYVDGHHAPMSDLEFYSKLAYEMCIGHGRLRNTTILRVYE